MMVMTAKVDFKKLMALIVLVFLVVLGFTLLLNGKKDSTSPTAASVPAVSANDGRVQFLKDFGWEVNATPKESNQVRVPDESSRVFERYNALQLSQGYDLKDYAGKRVMRYVYEVTNYPGATEPVYATLLVYKDKIIGGDITDTAVKGKIHGFKCPVKTETASAAPTVPSAEAEDSLG